MSATIVATTLDMEGRILAEETARNAWWPLDAIFAATYWNRVERREQRGLVAEWLRRGLQIPSNLNDFNAIPKSTLI